MTIPLQPRAACIRSYRTQWEHPKPFRVQQDATRRPGTVLSAQAASSSVTSDGEKVATAKQQIARLAGRKHGLDKSAEEKKVIREVIDELAALNQREQPDLTGSKWGLVYSESSGSSSGKIGPFIGRTEQEFPKDRPGQYFNRLYLGLTAINLLADYELVRPDRIDVDFQYIEISLGPLRFKKDFTTGGKGYWKLLYMDADYRVFETNKGNAFVLKRI